MACPYLAPSHYNEVAFKWSMIFKYKYKLSMILKYKYMKTWKKIKHNQQSQFSSVLLVVLLLVVALGPT